VIVWLLQELLPLPHCKRPPEIFILRPYSCRSPEGIHLSGWLVVYSYTFIHGVRGGLSQPYLLGRTIKTLANCTVHILQVLYSQCSTLFMEGLRVPSRNNISLSERVRIQGTRARVVAVLLLVGRI